MMQRNPPITPPPLALSAKAQRIQESPISALIAAAVGNPDLISFAAGLVDPLTLPVDECATITRTILADRPRAQVALQYGTTQGLLPLRQQLLNHLQTLEAQPAASFNLTPDDLVITTGSQQTLYLISDVLLNPGDIVITSNPSYFVFTSTLQSLGAQVLPVPVDDDGMDVEAVARLLQQLASDGRLPKVKFIYCSSYFDNPTGLTLSLPRRARLLEIVQQFSRHHRILILEDAAYRELRYDGPALPSIKSFDKTNQYTILTQTFSKPFAPGIKLGYTALPHDLMDPILQQKGNHDFGSSNFCQDIVLEALRNGSYASHLQLLRTEYRRKRDAMLDALRKHMPPARGIHWTKPLGGIYIWVTFPPAIDTSRQTGIFHACVDRGVLYVPGDLSFHPDPVGNLPRHHLRLNFAQVAFEQIEPGIARLAQVVQQHMPPDSSTGNIASAPHASGVVE